MLRIFLGFVGTRLIFFFFWFYWIDISSHSYANCFVKGHVAQKKLRQNTRATTATGFQICHEW